MSLRTRTHAATRAFRRAHAVVVLVALGVCVTLGLRRAVEAAPVAVEVAPPAVEAAPPAVEVAPVVEPGVSTRDRLRATDDGSSDANGELDDLDRAWIEPSAEERESWPPGWDPAPRGCHWFGGYPTNPFAGVWQRIESGEVSDVR